MTPQAVQAVDDPFADLLPKNQRSSAGGDPFADLIPQPARGPSPYGDAPRMVGATAVAPPTIQMPPAVVSKPEAPTIRMPGAVVSRREEPISEAYARARFGDLPHDPGDDFVSRVAQALASPVTHPVETIAAIPKSAVTAVRANAEQEAQNAIAMSGGPTDAVERTVTPKEGALASAQMMALGFAGPAADALGPVLAPLVGSRLAAFTARAVPNAIAGATFAPDDPLVGAVAGTAAGVAHAGVTGERATVTREITRDVGRMLPERGTRGPLQGEARVVAPEAPPAGRDFVVENLDAKGVPDFGEPATALEQIDRTRKATHAQELQHAAAGGNRSTADVIADFDRLDREATARENGGAAPVATAAVAGAGATVAPTTKPATVVIEEKPTVQQPTGDADLFGDLVTKEVPAQTSMFDENAGTRQAQEDAAKLKAKDQPISAGEMAARRDELGAPKQAPTPPARAELEAGIRRLDAIESSGFARLTREQVRERDRLRDELAALDQSAPDQGLLFDSAGAAPRVTEEQLDAFDDVIDAQGAAPHGPAAVHGSGFTNRVKQALGAITKPFTKAQSGVTFTLRQMSERLAKAIDVPIRERYFPFKRFRAKGVYKVNPEVARVIDLADLDTATHEAGHHVSKVHLGLPKVVPRAVAVDLKRLGVDLYGKRQPAAGYDEEGIAEVFKWYVIDRDHLVQRAPHALDWLEKTIFPAEPVIAKAYQQARADFELYQKQPAQAKVSALYATHETMRSLPDIADAVRRFLATKLEDDLAELKEAEKMAGGVEHAVDSPYLVAMASRTDAAFVNNALRYGIPSKTGKRLTVPYKALLDRIPKGKATEYKNYLIAERLNEQASHAIFVTDPQGVSVRLNDILTEAPHLLGTPMIQAKLDAAVKKLTGGMESNPAGGTGKVIRAGITYDEVRQLVEQGRKDAKLTGWADDYFQFSHQTLRLLVGHLLTAEDYHRIVDANQKYVDFHRFFPEDEVGGGTLRGSSRTVGKSTKGVSRLRGSSRSFASDPLESPILNLYRFARMVHKHQAFEALAKLADREGMGWMMEEVHPPKDMVKLSVDEVVKQQLIALGMDPADADNAEGAVLIGYVARQFANARDTRDMVLPRLVQGRRRWYKIGDKGLWNALEAIDAPEIPEWLRWAELMPRMLRAGTTLVPGFSVGTNWFRDSFEVAGLGRSPLRPPFYHFLKGLFHMARRDEMFHLFELEGGDVSGQMLRDRRDIERHLKDFAKSAQAKSTTVVRTPAQLVRALPEIARSVLFESWLRPLEALASVPERANRIGETGLVYDDLRKKAEAEAKKQGRTLTPDEIVELRKRAAEAGREGTLNFARGGQWVRMWNRIDVFFKPSVESAFKFGRESRSRPFSVLSRNFLWLTLPAIALYLKQRDDKEYQASPSWMKNTGLVYIAHNEDGSFKRRYYFPLPNLTYWLFGVVPTRVMQYMDTKNPAALQQIATAFNENVRPSLTPTALVPLIENTRDRSYFGDRPIEGPVLKELEPGYRAQPETGETARTVGRATNTSPAKIENVVRGYTGGLGSAALRGVDAGVRAVKGAMGKPTEVNTIRDLDPLHKTPVLGRFARGQGNAMSSEWVQEFYDRWDAGNEKRATLIALRKAGRDEEADDYLAEHRQEIATVATATDLGRGRDGKPGPLREAHDAMSDLRRAMAALGGQPLTRDAYRERVGELNQRMLDVARRALEASGRRVMPEGAPEQ